VGRREEWREVVGTSRGITSREVGVYVGRGRGLPFDPLTPRSECLCACVCVCAYMYISTYIFVSTISGSP